MCTAYRSYCVSLSDLVTYSFLFSPRELIFKPLTSWLTHQSSFIFLEVPQIRQKCNSFLLLFEFHCPRYRSSVLQHNRYLASLTPPVRIAHHGDVAFYRSFIHVMADDEVYWARFYSPFNFYPCETCLNIQSSPLLEKLILDAERERQLEIDIDNLISELVEEGRAHSRHRHVRFGLDPFERYPHSPPRFRPHTDSLLRAPRDPKDFLGKIRFRDSAMETSMRNMF